MTAAEKLREELKALAENTESLVALERLVIIASCLAEKSRE